MQAAARTSASSSDERRRGYSNHMSVDALEMLARAETSLNENPAPNNGSSFDT
jgi:hypothetical protein